MFLFDTNLQTQMPENPEDRFDFWDWSSITANRVGQVAKLFSINWKSQCGLRREKQPSIVEAVNIALWENFKRKTKAEQKQQNTRANKPRVMKTQRLTKKRKTPTRRYFTQF